MDIKKYCPKCKTDRVIKIFDVFRSRKTRVVCGHCGTVLMTQGELENYYWRYYGDC